ncbi:MAG TPA: COX15/CtaA family protein [Chloroflexota bacterium]|nr:COX15/CtaA family protein [Chloroflexota bacterium]
MRALVKPLALITTIGMFVVVVMGATVTNTGSENGCGRSWPLCNGQLIPEFAISTLIEFSHRAVTGVETMLVLATAIGAWYFYRQHREVRILAPLMVGTLFLQAIMGAWAVLYPQVALVLALHFGISLAAFASTLLVYAFLSGLEEDSPRRAQAVPRGFVRLAWFSVIYSLVVVYLGAYMRHSGMDLACADWPLCNGQVVPPFTYGVAVVLAHRFAAAGLILLLGWQLLRASRIPNRPDLAFGSRAAVVLVLLQSLAGATVVFSKVGLFSALGHAGLMALLFGSLCYVGLQVLPASLPRTVRAPETEPKPHAPAPVH